MDLIKFAYGPNVNLYRDVLKVSHGASDQQIQSAFVSRRYELFNELQNASLSDAVKESLVAPDGKPIAMTVRHFTEKKMDALIASYRLLSDGEKRRQYNMSMSLAAKKIKSNRETDSPLGVQDLNQSSTSSKVSEDTHPLDENTIRSNEINESRFVSTPYNPNKIPTPTKGKGPSLNAKKRLFESPNTSKNSDIEADINRNKDISDVQNVSLSDKDSCSFGSDSENEFTDENELTDYGTDETEFEEENRRRSERILKKKSKSSAVYTTPSPRSHENQEPSSDSSERKVTWSQSAKNSAHKQESRRKKKVSSSYSESGFSSWLRSKELTDQADMVESVGNEIAGAASDTMLAFRQIFNAFAIDDEALDSMAENIVDATENLSSSKSPKY